MSDSLPEKSCSVVLLAAGRSRRLGFDKILTELAGKPVLSYALSTFASSPYVKEVLIMTREDIFDKVQTVIDAVAPQVPVQILAGGAERQDSVWNGLQNVSEGTPYVAIHDAARPLVTAEMVETCLKVTADKGSAIASHPATDTMKEITPSDQMGCVSVEKTLDRSRIWQMQTPQVFEKELITEAYRKVQEEGLAITDDASAVEATGGSVWLADTGSLNLKITRAQDWELMETWFAREALKDLRKDLHDFANLLSPIVGYVPLASKYGGDAPKFLEYMAKLTEASNALQSAQKELHSKARRLSDDQEDSLEAVS